MNKRQNTLRKEYVPAVIAVIGSVIICLASIVIIIILPYCPISENVVKLNEYILFFIVSAVCSCIIFILSFRYIRKIKRSYGGS